MVYDVTEPLSFADINSYWLNEVQQYAEKNVVNMIMGNKMDTDEEKRVGKEEAEKWAEEKKILCMETSARTGAQVDTAFNLIAEKILDIKYCLSINIIRLAGIEEKKAKRKQKDTEGIDTQETTPTP
jgi:GTPase SAR1 family protein